MRVLQTVRKKVDFRAKGSKCICKVRYMKPRKRILIADDDSTNLSILSRVLSKDYKVETVPTGNECLSQLMRFRPHLVLLNILIPGISGHETCRRIKVSPLGDIVRVIIVSAIETHANSMHGTARLADDHLITPFDDEIVLSKVRSQFEAMDTDSDSMSDAKLFGLDNQMSEPQRARFAAALRRLVEKSSVRQPPTHSPQTTRSPA